MQFPFHSNKWDSFSKWEWFETVLADVWIRFREGNVSYVLLWWREGDGIKCLSKCHILQLKNYIQVPFKANLFTVAAIFHNLFEWRTTKISSFRNVEKGETNRKDLRPSPPWHAQFSLHFDGCLLTVALDTLSVSLAHGSGFEDGSKVTVTSQTAWNRPDDTYSTNQSLNPPLRLFKAMQKCLCCCL